MPIEEDVPNNGSTHITSFRRSTTPERSACLSSARGTLTRECAYRFIEEPCSLSTAQTNPIGKGAHEDDSGRNQDMPGVRKDGDQELLIARMGE